MLIERGLDTLRGKYPNVPEYVLKDMYRGSDEPFFSQLNRLTWEERVIDVNPSDFAPETLLKLKQRGFGDANPGDVPNDAERVEFQRSVAASGQQGQNEPIVVVKAVDGYRIWEGWHRAMSILRLGANDGPSEGWDRVKINAWVGSRAR